jgi:hypothetical protein
VISMCVDIVMTSVQFASVLPSVSGILPGIVDPQTVSV